MKSKITRLGKNHYEVLIDGKDMMTGERRRIRRRIHGRSTDAENLSAEIIRDIIKGTYIAPSNTTLGEYLDQWLDTYAKNLAPSTYAGYRRIVNKHLSDLAQIKLDALQPMQIQSYYNDKLRTLSKRTVRQHHAILREALQHAVKWQLISRNPADATEPPKASRPTINVYTPDQIEHVVRAAQSTRDSHLFNVAAYTGLRQGELLALRWPAVDLNVPCVRVQETVGRIDGEWVFRKLAKSKRSLREVELLETSVAALKAQRKMIVEEKLAADDYIANDMVFPDTDGNPLCPTALGRRFKKVAASVGVEGIRFHDLRHSHATSMLGLGINPKIVQERLGHETVNITLDTYSHVLKGLQSEAVKKLNRLVNK